MNMDNPFIKKTLNNEECQKRLDKWNKMMPAEQANELNAAHEVALEFNADPLSELVKQEKDPTFAKQVLLAKKISERVKEYGGMVLVVGGFVRDLVLRRFGYGRASKDVDLEVYGMSVEDLKAMLKEMAREPEILRELEVSKPLSVDEVGQSFGVIKIFDLDVAVTRRDKRTAPGEGRKAEAIPDHTMTFEQASFRRDLTINAMGMDPLTGQVFDVHNGLEDAKRKILRHVYDNADPKYTQFADDPLRVMRIMQFAGRFVFNVAPETAELCRSIDYRVRKSEKDKDPKALSKERLGEEWMKLFTKSKYPSVGLEAGRVCGVFEKVHPEIAKLYVKESDLHVWEDMKFTVDRVSAYIHKNEIDHEYAKLYYFSAICEAFKKGESWERRSKEIKSFLETISLKNTVAKNFNAAILEICKDAEIIKELAIKSTKQDELDELLRRMAYTAGKIAIISQTEDHLAVTLKLKDVLKIVDALGIFKEGEYFKLDKIVKRTQELHIFDQTPEDLVMGDDLKALGLKPGPEFSKILTEVKNAQLKGQFDNEEHVASKAKALKYVKKLIG